MEYSTDKFYKIMKEEFKKIEATMKKPNILIAGMTGSGKSSLINMIFGTDCAATGTGRPVTKKIELYESEKSSVRIYDSKGYELEEKAAKEFYDEVVSLSKKAKDPVHIVWYCVSCTNDRVTDYDLESLETFHDAGIPVAVVFTKADWAKEEALDEMKRQLPKWITSFETSITNKDYNHTSELIEWSTEHLPEIVRDAFIKAQRADLAAKWKKAHLFIIPNGLYAAVKSTNLPAFSKCMKQMAAKILDFYGLTFLEELMGETEIKGLLESISKILASTEKFKKLLQKASSMFSSSDVTEATVDIRGTLIKKGVLGIVALCIGEAISSTSNYLVKAILNNNNELVQSLISSFGDNVMDCAYENISSGKTTADDYRFEE